MTEPVSDTYLRTSGDILAAMKDLKSLDPAASASTDIFSMYEDGPYWMSTAESLSSHQAGGNPIAGIQDGKVQAIESPEDKDESDETDAEDDQKFRKAFPKFLKTLDNDIARKKDPSMVLVQARGLKPHVSPYPHQQRAAALAVHAAKTAFRGLIIADPPGFGKTLPALMAIAESRRPGGGPSIVVVPSSLCSQWMTEIDSCFFKTEMQAVLLSSDNRVSPVDLFKYDVIVTSYNYVEAEFRRLTKYDKEVTAYGDGETSHIPEKPHATLLSGIWDQPGAKQLGNYLVLDEAQQICNPTSTIYDAVQLLRSRVSTCLMLTSHPLDDTWIASFGLFSMLDGHPIKSLAHMRLAFTGARGNSNRPAKYRKLTGNYMIRFSKMLSAVMLRRPVNALGDLSTSCDLKNYLSSLTR